MHKTCQISEILICWFY